MLERDRGVGSVGFGVLLLCVLRARHLGRSSVEVHGSCDGRISLYPAAPIRLATLLHAWTYRAGGQRFRRSRSGLQHQKPDT